MKNILNIAPRYPDMLISEEDTETAYKSAARPITGEIILSPMFL